MRVRPRRVCCRRCGTTVAARTVVAFSGRLVTGYNGSTGLEVWRWTTELGVRIFGALHGAAFIAYLTVTLLLADRLRWSITWTTVLALAASVPPFHDPRLRGLGPPDRTARDCHDRRQLTPFASRIRARRGANPTARTTSGESSRDESAAAHAEGAAGAGRRATNLTLTTDANGDFSHAVTVPPATAAGQHTIVALGAAPDGTALLSVALGLALLAVDRVRRGLRARVLPAGCAYNV
ncbi:DUF3817 domain-containing protein [Dactylosporangium roseum]|uniref:DUF3817 domain-containing protein n=1 Tax=Dactylosporangium roseum TaxID=47989 RepID=UPI0031D42CC3